MYDGRGWFAREGRVTSRVYAVAISDKLGCTFRWPDLRGRYFVEVVCIGNRVWVPWVGHNLNLSNEKKIIFLFTT